MELKPINIRLFYRHFVSEKEINGHAVRSDYFYGDPPDRFIMMMEIFKGQ